MEALMIMVIGMTSVFVFLVMLILLMQLVDRCAPYTTPNAGTSSSPSSLTEQTQLVAVIQAAVTAYEADRKEH